MESSDYSKFPNRPQQFAFFLPLPLTRKDLRRNFAAEFNWAVLSCHNRLKYNDLRQEHRIDSAGLNSTGILPVFFSRVPWAASRPLPDAGYGMPCSSADKSEIINLKS